MARPDSTFEYGPVPSSAGAPPAPPAASVHIHIKRNTAAVVVMVFIAGFFFLASGVLLLALIGLAVSRQAPQVEAKEAPFVERTEQEEPGAQDKVLLLPIEGIIANTSEAGLFVEQMGMVDRLEQSLRQAKDDPNIKAVLLRINSPGGGITAADEMYHLLVTFRKETGRKLYATMGDVAASGGYYVAAAADRIMAQPTSVTGSIGVIMPLVSVKGAMDKLGIKAQPIKSRPMKDIGAFYSELNQDEREVLQGIVNELYDRFVFVVKEGADRRGVRALTQQKILALADGRVYTGEQAKANGLVDDVGYFQDAVKGVKELAGLKAVRLVSYAPKPKGLLRLLEGSAATTFSRDITVRFEGLPLPSSSLPMYLWCPGAPALVSSAAGE